MLSVLAAFALLVFATGAAAYVVLIWDGARMPVGNGWYGGYRWHTTPGQRFWGLVMLTVVAALSATAAAKAFALLYSAATLRPVRTRRVLIAGALGAAVVLAVTLASPETLCTEQPCPIERRISTMH